MIVDGVTIKKSWGYISFIAGTFAIASSKTSDFLGSSHISIGTTNRQLWATEGSPAKTYTQN